jgi:hypothetical protein
MHQEEKLYLRVAESLSACQQVEFELKNYMNAATEMIRKSLDDIMPYHIDSRHFENCALERLINHFKNHSDNTELVSDLQKFKHERNFIAHNALVTLQDPGGDFDLIEADKVNTRLTHIEVEAPRLSDIIRSEAMGIWVHVWFDDESDGMAPNTTKTNKNG